MRKFSTLLNARTGRNYLNLINFRFKKPMERYLKTSMKVLSTSDQLTSMTLDQRLMTQVKSVERQHGQTEYCGGERNYHLRNQLETLIF
ncbi:unnamed protein product [Staurois parvus]|uniref:Uncharacterized protein n=1 Tax=Staurois parvus TaxID=386267 RepID=A0ABN9EQH9_9NEOB|nr:unnamed protein product [Staurois parvus]